MAVFLFTYDLINEQSGFDYRPLWDELKRLKAHRTQYSAWLINLDNTAVEVVEQEVVEHFQKFVDSDDRLMATRLRNRGYHYVNAKAGTKDWLSKNPPT